MASDRERTVDYEALSAPLKALSYPSRLQILDALRLPKLISEIRVAPQRLAEGDNPERPAARQTLQTHLDRLVAAGLVLEVPFQQGDRMMRRYVINPEKLYVVSEELRRLYVRLAARPAGNDSTIHFTGAPTGPMTLQQGPRFVLVHGVYEGKVYLLEGGSEWIIGRGREAALRIECDPFVSAINTRVTRTGACYTITDLPESRNGTQLNWVPLEKGRPRALSCGDIVGIGRSRLVFVEP